MKKQVKYVFITGGSTIDFESVVIDSVVLTLVKDELYPDSTGTYNFHFEVRRLAEAVSSDDSIYRMSSTLPLGSEAPYFDQAVTVAATDTIASHLPAQTNAKTASDFPTLETHFLRLATVPPLFLLAFAPFAFFVAETLRVSA